MKSIEEYIKERKDVYKLNEFDSEHSSDNLQKFVNIVFDYFKDMKNAEEIRELTVHERENLAKYEKKITNNYSKNISDWLIKIFTLYGDQLENSLHSFLKSKPEIYFSFDDNKFKQIANEYIKLKMKKYPYLINMGDNIAEFFKEMKVRKKTDKKYRVENSTYITNFADKVWKAKKVDIFFACDNYALYFSDHPELWPVRLKIKGEFGYDYDLQHAGRDLLGLNDLFKLQEVHSIFKGNKQVLEYLVVNIWTTSITDEYDYWDKYLSELKKSDSKILN